MNILQILPELNVGGVETGTVDLAKYLTQKGHKAIVVSNGGVLVEELTKVGVKHYQLPVHKKNLWTAYCCVRKLIEIINQERIDVVHARSRVPGWIGFFATRWTEAHLVTTCHGYYSNGFYSRVMGFGKRVIAISQVIARHMVYDFAVPLENIRVIARSVDLDRFNIPKVPYVPGQPKVIVNIGRLTTLKGHTYFLYAMAALSRMEPHIKIQIIGDAPASKAAYKQELIHLARKLGLADKVEFLGNRRDIPELLSKADCLVLSTVTQEAFGRVIIEAQAAGVPVVATQVGGINEVIEQGETGLLVPPKDELAMATAVRRMLNETQFAQRCIVNARQKIQDKYTLKHMAEATIDVYREVIHSTNILIIKLSALGDIVLSTAAFKALRERYPGARIWCLTSPEGSMLLERCPHIDSTIVYDARSKNFKDLLAMADILRKFQFDKIIDLQNNRTSHLLASLAFPKQSYGYNNGKFGFLLSKKIKNDIKMISPVEHQFRILRLLGIEYDTQMRLNLWPSQREDQYVQTLLDSEWLGQNPLLVGINLAASAAWPTKNWPIEHISKLCDLLGALNIRVVLTGTEKDKARARAIIAKTKVRPANLVGQTTLLQLAALTRRCRVFISPDSAPLHVAASQGVPIIALFGPTDPRRHMPPADYAVVMTKAVKCAPCYSGQCKIQTQECLRGVTPEDVVKQIKQFIKL